MNGGAPSNAAWPRRPTASCGSPAQQAGPLAGRRARRGGKCAPTVLGRCRRAVLAGRRSCLFVTRSHLVGLDVEESEVDELTEQATGDHRRQRQLTRQTTGPDEVAD